MMNTERLINNFLKLKLNLTIETGRIKTRSGLEEIIDSQWEEEQGNLINNTEEIIRILAGPLQPLSNHTW